MAVFTSIMVGSTHELDPDGWGIDPDFPPWNAKEVRAVHLVYMLAKGLNLRNAKRFRDLDWRELERLTGL
jgi:hypothetical protein